MRSVVSTIVVFFMLMASGCAESKTVSFDSIKDKSLSTFVSESDLQLEFKRTKLCSKSKTKLVSSANYNFLKRKVNKLNEIANDDARRAYKFISSTSWEEKIDESIYGKRGHAYKSYIKKTLDPWLESILSSYTNEDKKTLNQDDLADAQSNMSNKVVTAAVKYCKLQTKHSDSYLQLSVRYNSLMQDIQSLSDEVPWYPEGFNEWSGDSSVAWKWYKGAACNLGDSCWHVKVITSTGCSSLYAEINIMDSSGNVIDYTNDVVGSLSAYSTAILEFSTYNDYASTGRVTKISCY